MLLTTQLYQYILLDKIVVSEAFDNTLSRSIFFMRINEIIKEKRSEQGLTQEQVAEYLGVSTPAVNKWERGGSLS